MHSSNQLAPLVQSRIDEFIKSQRESLQELGSQAAELIDTAAEFLSGGKRFRAWAVLLGYTSVQELELKTPLSTAANTVVTAASALEVFHAAALIHDDVIDRSATRRGLPTVHTQMMQQHASSGWRGSSAHFGVATAILLGDLLQTWADQLMHEATAGANPAAARRSRTIFNRMRTEVAFGQYFDVLEEQLPEFAPTSVQLQRATRVMLYKSAKYSVAEPLLIGAALAGSTPQAEAELYNYGVPAGIAFQLRDDILGVFGDSRVTGKPAGDDLIEGKRTVLVTLARSALEGRELKFFDEVFGEPDMHQQTLEMLQRLIRQSGAVNEVERMIERNVELAKQHARSAELLAASSTPLTQLVEKLAFRQL